CLCITLLHDLRLILSCLFFFFFLLPPPPRSSLFPYTTLFRSILFCDKFVVACLDNRAAMIRPFLSFFIGLLVAVPVELWVFQDRSEEHTSELQSQSNLVCRLLLEKKKKQTHAKD